MTIRVETGSRLHFALLDMTGDMGRVDGGIGLALQQPRIVMEASLDQKISSTSRQDLVESTVGILREAYDLDSGLSIDVLEEYPSHVGLGSSTQFILGVTGAYTQLNGVHPGPRVLAKLLGRGGTSGIGVGAFESGGFLIDGGHTFGPGKEKTSFLPSRASTSPPAPLIFRQDFPQAWAVDLFLPQVKQGLSGSEEIHFFEQHCPVEPSETAAIARIVLNFVLPGIAATDFATFARGINLLATLGFKRAEIENQDPLVQEMLQNLTHITRERAAIGMSSFGPTLYMIHENRNRDTLLNEVFSDLHDIVESERFYHYRSKARNTGAYVTYNT